jgi:hypothetical protein
MLPCAGRTKFMRKSLIALAVSLATAVPLSAQPLQCGPRAAVLDMLAAQDQSRRAIGLSGRAVMELFAAPDGGRWTITLTMPDGPMCLLANGVAFDGTTDVLPMRGTAL